MVGVLEPLQHQSATNSKQTFWVAELHYQSISTSHEHPFVGDEQDREAWHHLLRGLNCQRTRVKGREVTARVESPVRAADLAADLAADQRRSTRFLAHNNSVSPICASSRMQSSTPCEATSEHDVAIVTVPLYGATLVPSPSRVRRSTNNMRLPIKGSSCWRQITRYTEWSTVKKKRERN